jgi:hypothetical protein
MERTSPEAGLCFSLTMVSVCLLGVMALGLALAEGVLAWLGYREQMAEAAVTAGAFTAVSLLSLVPLKWLAQQGAEGVMQGFLLGLAVRLPVCLGLALVLAFATPLDAMAVGMWGAGWYLLLLATEVVLTIRVLMQYQVPAGDGSIRGSK